MKKAIFLFSLFIAIGFVLSQEVRAEDLKYNKTEIQQLKQLADSGNAEAQFVLAQAYQWGTDKGYDIEPNMESLIKYYTLSADGGYVPAQLAMVTELYMPQRNKEMTLKYLEMAMQQGNSTAMDIMGNLYNSGTIVKKDPNKAAEYYRMAEATGSAEALAYMGDLYTAGYCSAIKKDMKKGLEYYIKSAELGSSYSASMLHIAYWLGNEYVQPNEAEAAKWENLKNTITLQEENKWKEQKNRLLNK